jgi:two-component system, OmpR family, KDP operon response regulator KdpE
MTRVLVVDDEVSIRKALSLNLATRGYEVVLADSGEAAMQAVAAEHPDIVLLDLGLPGIDGIGTLEALRGWTQVPVIVLTVRDDEASKIAALDAGADDYITKPFSMGELLARLRAALRRAPDAPAESPVVTADHFRLDLQAHRAFVGDGEVRLTPTEWSIVAYLGRNPGRLITHRQLVTAVWGPTYDPDPNLLRVHMAHIRRKLEADPSRPRHFITDSGVGYRFEPTDGVGR